MRAFTYAAVILLLCITPLPAFSVTYHITDDGLGDYPTIQAAITASAAGDTIVLADGTYTGAGNWDLDFGGKNIVVRSENGRMLCVIDCGDGLSGEHRAFHFHSGEDSTAVVDDITIQEGYVETMEGGGILIENGSSPTIRNCHIGDCRAIGISPGDGHGGGIAIFDSSPRIIDNLIYSNSSIAGGGIYLEGGSAVIMGNDIYSNAASTGGAGIFSSESTPVIVNNWLDSNSGGGVAINNYVIPADDAIVHNNLFTHNIGPGEALLWGVQFSDVPAITSCTFFNNSGGGIYMNSSNGTVTDCILYTNGTTEIDADNASVTYSWVDGGYAGTGNITGTSISWDYGVYAEIYLPEGNECLDAGSAAASDICSDTQYGERCLNQMSALESERPDTGQVDVGYHYTRIRTTLYVPDDVATIQGAIDASVDGDRIEVGGDPLTMHGPIDFKGKAIHVISVGSIRRISGGHIQRAVTIINGETSSSILQNFHIYYGYAMSGGGIKIDGASPQILNCQVYECSAGYGGGVYVGNGSPYFFGFRISSCQANVGGGGIYVLRGSPEFHFGEVKECEALSGGGAICSNDSSIFDDVHFSQNLATGTGTIPRGGGIYSHYSAAKIHHCSFTNNTVLENGGLSEGGGLSFYQAYAQLEISHCVIAGNNALSGAGIYVSGGEIAIDNSIVAFNITGEAVYCESGSGVLFSCSDIYNNDGGDWVGCIAGQDTENNNFRADPVFKDLLNDMIAVAETSPCAQGNNPSCGWIGALDFSHLQYTMTMGPAGGGSYSTIQDAMSSSSIAGGDTIFLEDGVFTGPGNVDISFEGKSIVLKSLSGDPEQCIIDCGGSIGEPHRGLILNNRVGNAARIEGITIRNGWTGGSGGGVYLSRSHPAIKNCIFENCYALDGGGMSTYMGEGLIADCMFDSCTADDAGGGIYNNTSHHTIRDCVFMENWANWGGGGIYNHYSSPFIERCAFAGNTSDHWGGGVHNNHPASVPVLQNCTFSRNASPNGGGMFSRNDAAPVVYNSIIAFSLDGVAVHTQTGATTTLSCCDVYGNDDGDYVGGILGQDGIDGNFSADPLFCNELIHYLRLSEGSPCTQANGGSCGLIGAIWEGCHTTTDAGEDEVVPDVTWLYSCYPNPFNPCTRIAFDLSAPCHVSLRVYDVAGRLVRTMVDEERRAGRFEVVWNGTDDRGDKIASGVYFYRLRAGEFVESKKMILLR